MLKKYITNHLPFYTRNKRAFGLFPVINVKNSKSSWFSFHWQFLVVVKRGFILELRISFLHKAVNRPVRYKSSDIARFPEKFFLLHLFVEYSTGLFKFIFKVDRAPIIAKGGCSLICLLSLAYRNCYIAAPLIVNVIVPFTNLTMCLVESCRKMSIQS